MLFSLWEVSDTPFTCVVIPNLMNKGTKRFLGEALPVELTK